MKLVLFCFLLAISVAAFSQTDTTERVPLDSAALAQLRNTNDSLQKVRDSIEMQQQMERNMNSILHLQKENKAKQKKAAMTRIAIGVGFLVLLIVGLARRRKKKVV